MIREFIDEDLEWMSDLGLPIINSFYSDKDKLTTESFKNIINKYGNSSYVFSDKSAFIISNISEYNGVLFQFIMFWISKKHLNGKKLLDFITSKSKENMIIQCVALNSEKEGRMVNFCKKIHFDFSNLNQSSCLGIRRL